MVQYNLHVLIISVTNILDQLSSERDMESMYAKLWKYKL